MVDRKPQLLRLFADTEAAKQAIYERHPTWPCGRGCSDCCHRSFFLISRIEWEELAIGIRALPVETRKQLQAESRKLIGTNLANELGKPWREVVSRRGGMVLRCPLLDAEGACSVYAHRPVICRGYGYYTDDQAVHGADASIHGCHIVADYVIENHIEEMISFEPLRHAIRRDLGGDVRPIIAWLADSREFDPE